jgi:hypothetical protein
MPVSVVSFDGHAINDGVSYRAAWINYSAMPPAKVSLVPQARADSVDSGTYTVDGRSVALALKVLDYADRAALVAQLKRWFKRGTDGELVVTFLGDSDQFQLSCRVVNLVAEPTGVDFTVILASGQTALRAVAAETHPMTITGEGDSYTIVIDGDTDDETRLSVSLTPTSLPASGYLFQQLYRLPNMPGVHFGKIPWRITLDTATLIAAGKMQADCNDLRVFDGAVEINRWIEDPDTASTKIWTVLDISDGFSLALRTAVAGAGDIDTLEFTLNDATKRLLRAMPSSGILYHGTEWIRYNGKNVDTCALRVAKRGAYSTALQAHSQGDAFLWLEHPIRIKYGNSEAVEPSTLDEDYDLEKPVFDLASSTNTQWVWTASTLFRDRANPSRTGKWRPGAKKLGWRSNVYSLSKDTGGGEVPPSSAPAMGMRLAAFQGGDRSDTWLADTVTLTWLLKNPAEITTITATGQKYRSVSRWPGVVGLQRSANGVEWYNVWNEATPASAGVWEAWSSHSGVSLAAGTKFVRFVLKGTSPAVEDALEMSECLTCTLVFNSSNIPTGTLLGETSNYPLDITIANAGNGDSIDLHFPMRLDKTFEVDGEAFTVEYDGVDAHGAMSLDDESRDVWIRLPVGSNQIDLIAASPDVSSQDIGIMDVVLTWYRRRL